jgi:hypothetical protein
LGPRSSETYQIEVGRKNAQLHDNVPRALLPRRKPVPPKPPLGELAAKICDLPWRALHANIAHELRARLGDGAGAAKGLKPQLRRLA